ADRYLHSGRDRDRIPEGVGHLNRVALHLDDRKEITGIAAALIELDVIVVEGVDPREVRYLLMVAGSRTRSVWETIAARIPDDAGHFPGGVEVGMAGI